MIQPATPTIAPGIATSLAAVPADAAAGGLDAMGATAVSAAFAGLLAQQLDGAVPPAQTPVPAPAGFADPADAHAAALTPEQALRTQLAATLQAGGKPLPVAGNAAPDAAEGELDEPGDAPPNDADPAVLIAAPLIALVVPPALPAAVAAPAAPPTAADGPGQHDAAPAAAPLPMPAPEAHAARRSVAPATQPTSALAETVGNAPAEARTLVIERAAAAPSAPFTLAEGSSLPVPGALHLRPVLANKSEAVSGGAAPLAPVIADMAAPAAGPVPTEAAAPAPAPAPSAAPGPAAGADFAALVDRLIAARDAAQPGVGQGNVQLAVQHADFGQVSLNFRHDPDGLSVSAASADPDFARAVQAATAAAGSAGGSDVSSGQSRQQGGHWAGNPHAAPGQAHDRSPDGRQSPARGFGRADDPTDNHAPDAARAGPGGQRRGVFA